MNPNNPDALGQNLCGVFSSCSEIRRNPYAIIPAAPFDDFLVGRALAQGLGFHVGDLISDPS